MRRLVLVKHSLPEFDVARPASSWRLSDEGRRRCAPLANLIATIEPTVLVASTEPKATETASLIGRCLGLPLACDDRLREANREDVPWLREDAFDRAVARFFARPDERVFGRESARQARDRFSAGVDDALLRHPGDTVAIVAHGTVISLFVGERTGEDAFALWRRLGLPSFVVLARPDFRLLDVVATMPEDDPSRTDEVAT